MDLVSFMRTMGALAIVLGMLAAALWLVKRYNIRLPGSIGGASAGKRVEVVERTGIDGRRSVALIRRDGREHLVLLAPEGNLVIETAIIRDEIDDAAAAAQKNGAEARAAAAQAMAAQAQESFREMVSAVVDRSHGLKDTVSGFVERSAGLKGKFGNIAERFAELENKLGTKEPLEERKNKVTSRKPRSTPLKISTGGSARRAGAARAIEPPVEAPKPQRAPKLLKVTDPTGKVLTEASANV